jgi:hypothetical protein
MSRSKSGQVLAVDDELRMPLPAEAMAEPLDSALLDQAL